MPEKDNDALDIGRFFKGMASIFFVMTGIVTAVYKIGSLEARITANEIRINNEDEQINALSSRQDKTDIAVNDIQRKLDVAVEILHRLDPEARRGGQVSGN